MALYHPRAARHRLRGRTVPREDYFATRVPDEAAEYYPADGIFDLAIP